MYRSGRTEVVRTMYRNGHVPNWPRASQRIDYDKNLRNNAVVNAEIKTHEHSHVQYTKHANDEIDVLSLIKDIAKRIHG